MPIRTCAVLAVEGTQAGGKTTLVHALAAHYRERGIHVECTGEPARVSPFMEEIVLHGKGTFDLTAELDLFAAQFTTAMRAARNHRLLITDKTPANVLAYARLVLDQDDPAVRETLHAMQTLCRAWMPHAYDAVVYCRDHFDQQSGGDRFRDKVLDLQGPVDHTVHEACAHAGVKILDLPTGLDTASRVRWVTDRVSDLGLLIP
ncbi:hypothetical protein GCM10009760_16510 [Kitasatospora kazusensis]|uniref:NadR/Ttd14 AAA domain-containing protein n=1 Tax=Kitasatospora kazusensis TaxID=407974 RepID=A0ABP5KWE9_9ACTN